jgi:hypothetical protein
MDRWDPSEFFSERHPQPVVESPEGARVVGGHLVLVEEGHTYLMKSSTRWNGTFLVS